MSIDAKNRAAWLPEKLGNAHRSVKRSSGRPFVHEREAEHGTTLFYTKSRDVNGWSVAKKGVPEGTP